MDPATLQAARALATGDPLRALQGVGMRDDAQALALRGIAMAQLGELGVARKLLRRAARAFGPQNPLGEARCVVAEAEVALAARELSGDEEHLNAALAALKARGDSVNAAHGALLVARRQVLLGRLESAESALAKIQAVRVPAQLSASAALVAAEIAMRRLSTSKARLLLDRARLAAERSRIPALLEEVHSATARLNAPAARLFEGGSGRLVRLEEIEQLGHASELVVDACRRELRAAKVTVKLAERPVLFQLLCALAEAFPTEAARSVLAQRAFGSPRLSDSVRVRLRVELGRLRKQLSEVAGVQATARGFVLEPKRSKRVLLLVPPTEGEADALLGLLSDGQAWSTSGLAEALGKSQRTVQRALSALESAGRVSWLGHGRGRRWSTPPFGVFATPLLLVARPEPR